MFASMDPPCPRCAHQVAKKGLLGWECGNCFLKSTTDGEWKVDEAVTRVADRREFAYKASAGVTLDMWKAFHEAGFAQLYYASCWPIEDSFFSAKYGPRWVAGVLTGPDNDLVCVKDCKTVEEANRFLSPGGWTPEDAVEQALVHLERLTGSRVGSHAQIDRSDQPCPACGSYRHHEPGPGCDQ
jgi:hypothetical protein